MSAVALLGAAASLSASTTTEISQEAVSQAGFPKLLSEYGFFNGGAGQPSLTLISYSLRTPLFSDYAEKQRFIFLPENAAVKTDDEGRLEFPVGTALIKSFGYANGDGALKIIETRVLLHRTEGWVALPYVWRADGSDADLRVGGTRVAVDFKTPRGVKLAISYAVPNKNQCKQCHSEKDDIVPIGLILGNMVFTRPEDGMRLSARLQNKRTDFDNWAKWDDPASGNLDSRANAYLRVNCGHCHNPKGSASNSGLFYDGKTHERANSGIFKRPVAAGRGSGNLDFVISPTNPEQSILIYRMKSLDPGIAMPELGRNTVHDEGIELLANWIKAMPAE